MLNEEMKKEALATHKESTEKYDSVYDAVQMEYARLYQTHKRTIVLIESIESFINSIANTPKEFAPKLSLINVARKEFCKTEDYAAEAKKAALESGFRVVAGGAASVAAAKMTPHAIKWVFTTLEKTSKGATFSTLLGVLKNKAASAGPYIGVGIFVLNTTISLIALECENKKIAEQSIEEANAVRIAEAKLIEICAGISHIRVETEELMGSVSEQFKSLELLKDCAYAELPGDEQLQLGSLVNNTLALAKMLNKVVEWSAEAEE